jgi:SET domain-containing protein
LLTQPNCKAKIEMVEGKPRILIYTIRDIQCNEELTYDYQFKVDVNDRLVCKCKAPNCQGRLT